MANTLPPLKRMLKHWVAPIALGPPGLAFIPAFCLAAYWFGGEGALMVMAAILPVIYLAGGSIHSRSQRATNPPLGVLNKVEFDKSLTDVFEKTTAEGRQSAVFVLEIEEHDTFVERHGPAAADVVAERVGERILAVLRKEDSVGQIADARFGIITAPVRHLDLEICIQLSSRIQAAVEEPIALDGTAVYVSASIGFCQHARIPKRAATEWVQAASIALREALQRGPSAIRAFSAQMQRETLERSALREEAVKALELGQFQPWFQPQISTDTGELTGFEALARWSHPTRGLIPPKEFLAALEEAGMLERLAELMMYHALAALKAWDAAGITVPQVGVNFAGSELNNPRLIEKIKWELDRFDLTPERLAIEILETVVASAPDDTITRNINALGALGCRIDLDDFGTGHASITSIRRFAVNRIKIDRSFVTRADRDPEQQRMISAILTMAERLGVETLAEGVETVGEHVLLAQLGCDHVQGFGIAKPMPFEKTLDWVAQHKAKLADVPRLLDGKRM